VLIDKREDWPLVFKQLFKVSNLGFMNREKCFRIFILTCCELDIHVTTKAQLTYQQRQLQTQASHPQSNRADPTRPVLWFLLHPQKYANCLSSVEISARIRSRSVCGLSDLFSSRT